MAGWPADTMRKMTETMETGIAAFRWARRGAASGSPTPPTAASTRTSWSRSQFATYVRLRHGAAGGDPVRDGGRGRVPGLGGPRRDAARRAGSRTSSRSTAIRSRTCGPRAAGRGAQGRAGVGAWTAGPAAPERGTCCSASTTSSSRSRSPDAAAEVLDAGPRARRDRRRAPRGDGHLQPARVPRRHVLELIGVFDRRARALVPVVRRGQRGAGASRRAPRGARDVRAGHGRRRAATWRGCGPRAPRSATPWPGRGSARTARWSAGSARSRSWVRSGRRSSSSTSTRAPSGEPRRAPPGGVPAPGRRAGPARRPGAAGGRCGGGRPGVRVSGDRVLRGVAGGRRAQSWRCARAPGRRVVTLDGEPGTEALEVARFGVAGGGGPSSA